MKRDLAILEWLVWPDWLTAAITSVAPALIATVTTAASVVGACCSRVTPPAGSPSVKTHGGNSAPARALVAGLGKSERCGEPWGAK
jgi:hypothetical protein